MSRIETGRIGINEEDLDKLCRVYEINSAGRDRLKRLAQQGQRRVWLDAYGHVLRDQLEKYVGLEAEATAIHGYYAMLVPGLLQTDEYARAVIEGEIIVEDPTEIEQRVAVKMARQATLSRQPPPIVEVILDEAVVRRQIGDAGVMHRQLRRLRAQSERNNITVRVLPFSAGAHRGVSGSFVVLTLPSEMGGQLVYCEGMTGGVVRTKPSEIQEYEAGFKAISELALSPEESADFLAEAAG